MKHKTAVEIIKNWPRDQVQRDLEYILDQFFSKTCSGLRIISEKTCISKKTLTRILKGESSPNQQSVMRFYEYYFSLISETDLSIQHQWIKDYFLKVLNSHYGEIDKSLEKKLEEDIIFRKLYVRLTMKKLSKDDVQNEFGEYGLDTIDLMSKMGVLQTFDNEFFEVKPDVSISKSPLSIKKMINELNEDFLNATNLSELNKNSAFYFCENINKDAYQTILEASEEMKKTIRRIVNSPESKGDIPFFTTSVIDKMDNNGDRK